MCVRPSLLDQLHDGVGVHKELVVFRPLLERHSMTVDDVGYLGVDPEWEYGRTRAWENRVIKVSMYGGWNTC